MVAIAFHLIYNSIFKLFSCCLVVCDRPFRIKYFSITTNNCIDLEHQRKPFSELSLSIKSLQNSKMLLRRVKVYESVFEHTLRLF